MPVDKSCRRTRNLATHLRPGRDEHDQGQATTGIVQLVDTMTDRLDGAKAPLATPIELFRLVLDDLEDAIQKT